MDRKPSSKPQITRVDPRQGEGRRAVESLEQGLKALAQQRIQKRAEQEKLVDADIRAVARPLEKLVEADPAAVAARAKLRKVRLGTVTQLHPESVLGKARPGRLTTPLLLPEQTLVVTPPYDFEWHWGNAQRSQTNLGNGYMGISGASGGAIEGGTSEAVHSGSGIAIVLTSNMSTNVTVRPFIDHVWSFGVEAYGFFSAASSAGGLDAACFLNGNVLDGVHRSQVFEDDGGFRHFRQDDGSGIASVDDLTVSFHMEPGAFYGIPFGAWIDCDHNNGWGVAAAEGRVEAQVHWIVVETSG
jgi:hypothetical protein